MDEYYILKPPGSNYNVSDYLHSILPHLTSHKEGDKEYSLITQEKISIKRFRKIYQSKISFEPLPKGKMTISKDASEEVYIELLVNQVKEMLHTIDLPLYLSILIWEENIFAKARILNVELMPNFILFEKIFTFIKCGYSTKQKVMVDIFGMPSDIYFWFDKIFDSKNQLPIK